METPMESPTQTVVFDLLDAALSRFRDDLRAGHARSIQHYEQLFPDVAEELRELIPSIAALEQVGAHSLDQSLRTSTPRRIGDYEIEAEIGRGGMAVVYAARDPKLGRTIALKVLPFSSALNKLSVLRFRNEAQVLAQLDHPNIVPVFDTGDFNGSSFLAMKRIRGVPLDDVFEIEVDSAEDVDVLDNASTRLATSSMLAGIRQLVPDSCSERLRYIATLGRQAARALEAAHECGVIHRDIKPSNLMLDEDGHLWITDFGLAFVRDDDKVTQTGQLLGTVRYMSPEQSRGERALVDRRSDVYSLGITLYELTTSQPAFRGSAIEMLEKVKNVDVVPPQSINPDFPRDLQNIILKACAKSRDDRYETAGQLADDLDRFLAGENTIARRPSFSERSFRWMARRRRTVAVILSFVAILTIASLVTMGMVLNAMTKTDAALKVARENFHETQAVVDRFGLQLDGELALIPGTDNLRRAALHDVITHYRGFIKRSEQSEGLTVNLAIALNKVASLLERVGTSDEAMAAHQEARSAYEHLLQKDPNNREWKTGRSLCDNNIGLLFAKSGMFKVADEHYVSAVRTLDELTRRDSGGIVHRELGLVWNNLGLLRIQQKQAAEAISFLTQSRDILATFNTTHPDDEQGQRYLAATLENLASATRRHSPTEARKSHQQAIEIQRRLAQAHPNRQEYQQQLAVSYDGFGLLLAGTREHKEAEVAFSHAAEIQTELLKSAPNSPVLLRQLAWSGNHRGQTLARLGRVSEATVALRASLQTQQQVCNLSGGIIRDLSVLGGIWNNLGFVLEGQQDTTSAIESYQAAVENLTATVSDIKATDQDRDALERAKLNLARMLSRQSRTL